MYGARGSIGHVCPSIPLDMILSEVGRMVPDDVMMIYSSLYVQQLRQEDFDRAQPVLKIIGSRITLIGPLGCGQIAKAVNQVVIGGTYQALAEGLALACRAGAHPERPNRVDRSDVAVSMLPNFDTAPEPATYVGSRYPAEQVRNGSEQDGDQ